MPKIETNAKEGRREVAARGATNAARSPIVLRAGSLRGATHL